MCRMTTSLVPVILTLLVSSGAPKNLFRSSERVEDVAVSGDSILIASVNKLWKLSVDDLSPLKNATIGPVEDSPWCSADLGSCLKNSKPTKTDVHTKIFLPFKDGSLLHCGSTRQGTCKMYTPNLIPKPTSQVPVAANSLTESTTALLLDNKKLVVAATPTQESPYRDPFPAVAIRGLPDLYVENAGDLEGEAAVFLRASYKSSFRYIHTFTHQHFVFIVATQTSRQNRASKTTKLIRFCRNDTKFVSYSEIELQCRGEDNTNYQFLTAVTLSGDRLVASFKASKSSKNSFLCVYSMQRIKLTYWYNMDRCRSGTDSFKLPHIGRDGKCVNKSHLPLDEDSCELGVGGSIESVEMAVRDIDEDVTSLLSIHDKVIFVGTAERQVIMLKWQDGHLDEYGRKDVGDGQTGSEVTKMVLSGDYFYVQLPYGIVKEEISSCSHYDSCSSCLLSVDPLCQWCHPTQSCTTPSRCSVPVSPICPKAEGIPVPPQIAVNQSSEVTMNIKHLPPPNGFSYRCHFGSTSIEAKWSFDGVSCASRPVEKAEAMLLTLTTSLSIQPIVSHNFTVYDCGVFNTCSKCGSSNWNCEWCSSSQTCVPENFCLKGKTSACVKLLEIPAPIAYGSSEEVTINADNLDILDQTESHFCEVDIDGVKHKSLATIRKNKVKCGKLEMGSSTSRGNTSAIISLVNKEGSLVDTTNISLYSCSALALDCSSCLSLPPTYKCGWCHGQCSHQCHTKENVVCDPPKIISFSPSSGPMEGGTVVTINGKDMGSSIEDVRGKVFIAGSRCDIIEYKTSSQIRCVVEKGDASGPIKISVGRVNMKTVESGAFYSFAKVSVFSAYPLFGPVAGGTKITLYGQNLNIGTNLSITVAGKPCMMDVKNSTATSMTCFSPQGDTIGKTAKVMVTLDQATLLLDSPFEYRPNPVVLGVYPQTTFKSGGKMVTVLGQNLDFVLSPKLFFASSPAPSFHVVSDLGSCRQLNSTVMTCITPRVSSGQGLKMDYHRFPVGFVMDNVIEVRNLGRRIEMHVVPDPQIAPFKGIRHHQGDQPLILEGNYLNRAAEPNDYKVFIGAERCYVTLIDVKQLVCSGPLRQPAATDEKGTPLTGGQPLVTVLVGNVRTEVGLLEYADQSVSTRLTTLVLVTFFLLTSIIVATCLVWKRKRYEREKEYRKIQLQMESLESNVRKECKQAFAELQTTLAPSPTNECPPLVQFPQFVDQLLWSDGILTSTPTLTHTLPVTLAQFHTLLSNKKFLFAVVEAAESDTSVTPTEKSLLSSLLISVLLRNFPYCTEVVVDLLKIHISKCVKAKQAEILFRKSESVVEKLVSKWLAISIYSQITPQVTSFFQLYKALKCQTEKGPVDAVTGSSRYTINESKLLRDAVDFSTIEIDVIPLEGGQSHRLEVHACDSASQVKQKVVEVVYRSLQHSQRPALNYFDLQYDSPRIGTVTMSDVDVNQSSKKGPSRLKTIADYGIESGSMVKMVPAAYKMDHYRLSMADSGQSSWSSLDRQSPTYIYHPGQYYHLTKPSTSSGTSTFKKKIDDRIPKSIPEVYLTRLLTCKGTVQLYVEDFLESVLYLNQADFPPILKFFFDLLDREAANHSVSENISQQWKANSYALRTWVNLVKNPKLVLDIADSNFMDGNLSTIAQTMMDCFSSSDPILGAHSPSSRLLFAKDVARLRPLSSDLFKRIKRSPQLSPDATRAAIANVANDVSQCKGSSIALSELLSWVRGNGIKVSEILTSDPEAIQQRLPQRLNQVLNVCQEQESVYSTIPEYY